MAAPRKDNIKEKILQATTELLKTTALADISLAEIADNFGGGRDLQGDAVLPLQNQK